MAKINQLLPHLLSAITGLMVFTACADNHITQEKPNFKDYPAGVSYGPFSTQLNLNDKQKRYSDYWKKNMQKELSEPVSFAGHYRLYTQDQGQGEECLIGVCGWILDKLSGTITSGLPEYNGSRSYGSVGDNGAPVGQPLEILVQKNSLLMVLTGQAIPQKIEHKENGIPLTYPCKKIYYTFQNNQFRKVFEDKEGCNGE